MLPKADGDVGAVFLFVVAIGLKQQRPPPAGQSVIRHYTILPKVRKRGVRKKMNMGKRISAAITFGLMIGTVTPSLGMQFQTMGVGAYTCGAYVEQPLVAEAGIHWVLGFITGINVMDTVRVDQETGGVADLLKGADRDAVKVWLDNYCKANPMKDIVEASVALVVEMRRSD